MAVQDRNSAVQGEVVRLFRTFLFNGNLYQMQDLPTVEIVTEDGTVLDNLTAATDSLGLYYADWTVPFDLPVGKYHDRWTYSYDTETTNQETSYFQVYTSDTWLSFTGSTSSNEMTDKMRTLIRALENDFIYESQHIPLYWEQGMHTADAAKLNFAYGNWRDEPKPIVRKNGRILEDGWLADYKGNVFFQEPPDDTDDIHVTYTFSYFSEEELAGFINEGLRAMNSLPPASWSYRSVNTTPQYWDYGILLMAAVHAMRRLVMGLNFQERSIIFGEDPERARAAQSNFQQLYQDYSSLWKEISEGIKKALPATGMVIVPEYTLPGGRSRWYRYLYTTSAGG
jgi:hypothetical protein